MPWPSRFPDPLSRLQVASPSMAADATRLSTLSMHDLPGSSLFALAIALNIDANEKIALGTVRQHLFQFRIEKFRIV